MYSTCLFCNESLGANEVIEHFPVGRRLAFDAAKGRLWVVCRRCERWNLTPLEERWEAIEEAERLFADTRLRVSTDNIGLAKLRDGTTLIRIGSALRPEIAAWRYGDQFGRRRRRHMTLTALGVGAVAAVAIAGPATGLIAGGGWGLWQGANALHNVYQSRRVRVRLRSPDGGSLISVRKSQLEQTAIIRMEDDSWALRIASGKQRGKQAMELRPEKVLATFSGSEALRAASKLLPAMNESGAKRDEVQSAVQVVLDAGDPERLFQRYASRPSAQSRYRAENGEIFNVHMIARLPKEVRLALEMAAHDEQERRALEGELAILEAAWRDAEEVAKIADDMFVTDDLTMRLDDLRKKD
jgi:hypothetical protein